MVNRGRAIVWAVMFSHATATCSPALRVIHPLAENTPPRNGAGLRMTLSGELAPDWVSPFMADGRLVARRRFIGNEAAFVFNFEALWEGEYRAHIERYGFGQEDDLGDEGHGDGGRIGLARTFWRKGVLAASTGFEVSFLWASHDGQKAESQLAQIPLLVGVRGMATYPGSRWIILSAHAYTGFKLMGGVESLWIGDPRDRRTEPILAVQGPVLGLGTTLLIAYASIEISPVWALLPVADRSISMAFPVLGLNFEVEAEKAPTRTTLRREE